jgi:hypothetical protein
VNGRLNVTVVSVVRIAMIRTSALPFGDADRSQRSFGQQRRRRCGGRRFGRFWFSDFPIAAFLSLGHHKSPSRPIYSARLAKNKVRDHKARGTLPEIILERHHILSRHYIRGRLEWGDARCRQAQAVPEPAALSPNPGGFPPPSCRFSGQRRAQSSPSDLRASRLSLSAPQR